MMRTMHCIFCGTNFGLDDVLYELRRQDGRTFYCPNGHQQHYTDTAASKLENVTKERDTWRKEAQRLLDLVDEQRGVSGKRSKHFNHVFYD